MTPTSCCDGLIFLPSICYDCDEGRGDPTTCHYINIPYAGIRVLRYHCPCWSRPNLVIAPCKLQSMPFENIGTLPVAIPKVETEKNPLEKRTMQVPTTARK